jgi:UDP-N-acetylglucosamine transferase subunit ALG13/glycosyltransferase involved in cell wall biosynthesis
MIFISVGTHSQPFTRLLREAGELVDRKLITEEVIVQSGNTPFTHPKMKIIPFMDIAAFEKTLSNARVFVTHAGEGNIGTALQLGVPLIIVPRRAMYNEHTNDHQLELAEAIASRGDAVVVNSISNWKTLEKEATKHSPKKEVGFVCEAVAGFAREAGIVARVNAIKSEIPKNASIIVATFNGGDPLIQAVNGMLNQDFEGDYEIIITDDGSTDGVTPQLMRKHFSQNPRVKLFFLSRSGVCRARNNGIQHAKYDIVVNMDHDDLPERDWLRTMVSQFNEADIGVVSGWPYGGTCTAFRKKLLDLIGGYDEDYFYYREDSDLSFRIMDLGFRYKQAKGVKYREIRTLSTPRGWKAIFKYTYQRLKYHMNDVLLHKKHRSQLCNDFLHVRWKFFVDPLEDFKVATGLWGDKKEFSLSSPRGMTFLPNASPLHFAVIVTMGLGYAFAIKWARLAGSIKHGHLLV